MYSSVWFSRKKNVFLTRRTCRSIFKGQKNEDFSLENQTPRARQIFAPDRKNPLNIALAMSGGLFALIHQKFGSRRMDVTPDYTL
jgi:hypothetical protein